MAQAGTVTIDFAAETAKFTAELKKVRSELNTLRGATASISRQFRMIGQAALGVFSGALLGSGIRAIVSATVAAEQELAQLDAALKSTANAAGFTRSQLVSMAEELSKSSTFSAGEITQAQTRLLTYTTIVGDQYPKALQIAIDQSARLGLSLTQSAEIIGRALETPSRGVASLTRQGFNFTEEQKKLLKSLEDTGRVAEAQRIVMDVLTESYGGAAAAARNTLGGALTAVKNAFGDLLTGDKASITGVTASVNELADTLNSPGIRAGFAGLIQSIAAVGTAAANSIGWLVRFGDAAGRATARAFIQDADLTAAQALTKELRSAEDVYTRNKVSGFFTAAQLADERAYIETLKERIRLAEQAEALRNAPENPRGGGRVGGGRGVQQTPEALVVEKSLEQLKLLQSVSDQRLAITQREFELSAKFLDDQAAARARYDEESLQRATSISNQRLAIAQREFDENSRFLAEQQDLELQYQQAKRQMQQDTVNAGIGLLQFLAQRSKTAAVALILVNRGLMIAQTIQNTAAAVMKAFAIYGPTPQGFAAAATMKALGAIQIGLIAATGALEIGAVVSGDRDMAVGPGTPNNPLHTDATGVNGVQERGATTVYINGVVTNDVIQQLLDGLEDRFNDDVVIIPYGAAQAAAIRGD